ncbi:MAG: hypothetical protein IKZ14_07785 [Muribaculaceae bacterium]|nr:hypothetical protein [Muribaculaceae bacterium]
MKQYFMLLGALLLCSPWLIVYAIATALSRLIKSLTFALLNDADQANEALRNMLK